MEARQVCGLLGVLQCAKEDRSLAIKAGRVDFHANMRWRGSWHPISYRRQTGHVDIRQQSSMCWSFTADEADTAVTSRQAAENSDFWEKRYQAHCKSLSASNPSAQDQLELAEVVAKLKGGQFPAELLERITNSQAEGVWHVLDFLFFNDLFGEAFQVPMYPCRRMFRVERDKMKGKWMLG